MSNDFTVPTGGGLVAIEVHAAHDDAFVWVNGQIISRTHGPTTGYCEFNNVTLLLSEGDQVSWTAGKVLYAWFIPYK